MQRFQSAQFLAGSQCGRCDLIGELRGSWYLSVRLHLYTVCGRERGWEAPVLLPWLLLPQHPGSIRETNKLPAGNPQTWPVTQNTGPGDLSFTPSTLTVTVVVYSGPSLSGHSQQRLYYYSTTTRSNKAQISVPTTINVVTYPSHQRPPL